MLQQITAALRSRLARFQREGEPFIRGYSFPEGLSIKLRQRYPDWTDATIERVLAGLREYLLICVDAIEHPVPMPSKAVDAAWHEFILFTRHYCAFCDRAYGNYLHHTPSDRPMLTEMYRRELGRLWYLHCLRSGQHPMNPTAVPLLLAIDAELGLTSAPPPSLVELAALPLPVGMVNPRTGAYVPTEAEAEMQALEHERRARNAEGKVGSGCAGGGNVSGGACGGGQHGHGGHGCSGGGCNGGGGGCSGGGGCGGGGN